MVAKMAVRLRLPFRSCHMLRTDLSKFSYKKGSLVPWCKRCGAQHFYRNGKNKQGITKYRCRQCNFRFVWTSDLPRRNVFSSVISLAVELYCTVEIALRRATRILREIFAVRVSHEAIRLGVLRFGCRRRRSLLPMQHRGGVCSRDLLVFSLWAARLTTLRCVETQGLKKTIMLTSLG